MPRLRLRREGDREAVLRVLGEWDATGIVIEDLVDEVKYLSRWDVGEILKEVEHLLEYRDEYRLADAGGVPRKIIRLRRGARGGCERPKSSARSCDGAAATKLRGSRRVSRGVRLSTTARGAGRTRPRRGCA